MSVRENAERLLETLMKAIEAAKPMLNSKDEDVKVFAIDAIQDLSEKAMLLIGYLMKRPIEEGERNPLARRVRRL